MLYKQEEARLIRGIGLIASVLLGVYLSYELYGSTIGGVWVEKNATVLSSVLLAVTIVAGVYVTFINKRCSDFLIEVDSEAKKIHWPDWLHVKKSTVQVIIVMFFFLIYLLLVDTVLGTIREAIIR